jgi:hypothetical protein
MMLELPHFEASGCFVLATAPVLVLPWFPGPCQGMHTTSPPAASLGPASFGRPCHPFWDWAWPCSHFDLERAHIAYCSC